MNKYSINEIMEMAIQTERLGYQYYTSMAEKFKENEELQKLFSTLASKEQAHEKTFAEIMDMVSKRGPEPVQWEEVSDYLRAFVESEFFLGKGKALPALAMENIKSVKDAVEFALGFEKETLLYFMELKESIKDKDIMDGVINEEKSHITWLARFKAGLA